MFDDTTVATSLRRTVSGPLLILYGVGTMIGAGIYALIGEVAAAAGLFAPLAFLLASVIAALTALSFGELAARYPRSAGEAAYVSAAFSQPRLAVLVGLLIVASGIVSSGVMFRGFVGYAGGLATFEPWHAYVVLAILTGALASWGIGQSLIAIAVITLVEAGAIIFVVGVGVAEGVAVPAELPPLGSAEAVGIVAGAVLAFYAFIGFEDMVNIAEEVKDPRRTMPKAIIIAMAVTAVIYVALALVAVSAVPITALGQSQEPMTLIVSQLLDRPAQWMSYIAILAVLNGALVQIVMASRVLYGLSRQELIGPLFGRLNATTQTPVVATVLVVALILLGAALLPLATLAQFTSLFLLTVFALVNVALIRVKTRPDVGKSAFTVPIIIPYLGAGTAAAFAVASAWQIAI